MRVALLIKTDQFSIRAATPTKSAQFSIRVATLTSSDQFSIMVGHLQSKSDQFSIRVATLVQYVRKIQSKGAEAASNKVVEFEFLQFASVSRNFLVFGWKGALQGKGVGCRG